MSERNRVVREKKHPDFGVEYITALFPRYSDFTSSVKLLYFQNSSVFGHKMRIGPCLPQGGIGRMNYWVNTFKSTRTGPGTNQCPAHISSCHWEDYTKEHMPNKHTEKPGVPSLLYECFCSPQFSLCIVILISFTFTLFPGSWMATPAWASLSYLSILITHRPQPEKHRKPPTPNTSHLCSEIQGAATAQNLNLCTFLTYNSQGEGDLG